MTIIPNIYISAIRGESVDNLLPKLRLLYNSRGLGNNFWEKCADPGPEDSGLAATTACLGARSAQPAPVLYLSSHLIPSLPYEGETSIFPFYR